MTGTVSPEQLQRILDQAKSSAPSLPRPKRTKPTSPKREKPKVEQKVKKVETPKPAPDINMFVNDMIQKGVSNTDSGYAERFHQKCRDQLFYVLEQDRWYYWDGKRWKEDSRNHTFVTAKAEELAREILLEQVSGLAVDKKDVNNALDYLAKTSIGNFIDQSRWRFSINAERLDGPDTDWLFNTLTGTLDLRTMKERPWDPKDLITKLARVRYDSAAKAPKFKEFIETALPGDLGTWMQRYLGSTLAGVVKDKKFTINYHEEGDTGRTTLNEAILHVLGEYGKVTPFSTLLETKSDKIRNDIAALRGARFVVASETNQQRVLDDGLIKQLSGKDTMTARFLFKEEFSFRVQFKLFLQSNEKPIIKSKGLSMWERVAFIRWPNPIPKDKQDRDFGDKLKAEASGVLNWLLTGCALWQKEGLGASPTIEATTAEYRRDMDSVLDFIETYCKKDPEAQISFNDFNGCYGAWCHAAGRYKENETAVGRRLGSMFEKRKEAVDTIYRGLRLVDGINPKIFSTSKYVVIDVSGSKK